MDGHWQPFAASRGSPRPWVVAALLVAGAPGCYRSHAAPPDGGPAPGCERVEPSHDFIECPATTSSAERVAVTVHYGDQPCCTRLDPEPAVVIPDGAFAHTVELSLVCCGPHEGHLCGGRPWEVEVSLGPLEPGLHTVSWGSSTCTIEVLGD